MSPCERLRVKSSYTLSDVDPQQSSANVVPQPRSLSCRPHTWGVRKGTELPWALGLGPWADGTGVDRTGPRSHNTELVILPMAASQIMFRDTCGRKMSEVPFPIPPPLLAFSYFSRRAMTRRLGFLDCIIFRLSLIRGLGSDLAAFPDRELPQPEQSCQWRLPPHGCRIRNKPRLVEVSGRHREGAKALSEMRGHPSSRRTSKRSQCCSTFRLLLPMHVCVNISHSVMRLQHL